MSANRWQIRINTSASSFRITTLVLPLEMDSPHFVSTLTLACLQLQESLENSSLTLSEKNELIFKHLNWIQEQDREPIPEFGAGSSHFHHGHETS